MKFSQQGKIIVITGASSGIGKATAQKLSSEGATVIGISRSQEKLNHLKSEVGDHFIPIVGDVRNEQQINDIFTHIFSTFHRIDSLINNAGLGIFKPIDQLSFKEWNQQIESNLSGTFLCSKAVVPYMKQQKEGVIINIASIAGKIGLAEASGYNASKFGVVGLSESMMQELRDFGIRVNCICPGSVDTPFFDQIQQKMSSDNMMTSEDIAETISFLLQLPKRVLMDTIILRPLARK